MFGGVIGRTIDNAVQAGNRGDVDNIALPTREHFLANISCQQIR
jgi:hypothetical protein